MFDPTTVYGTIFYTICICLILAVAIVWFIISVTGDIIDSIWLSNLHSRLFNWWDKITIWWWKRKNL